MILSAQQLFSDKQAITVTALSENVIDRGATGTPYGAQAPLNADTGLGSKVPLLVQVVEDFAGLTSLTVHIATGDDETLGTDVVSQTIEAADLVAGKQIALDCLPNQLKQFIGVNYEVDGTATAGSVTAAITMGNQTNLTGA